MEKTVQREAGVSGGTQYERKKKNPDKGRNYLHSCPVHQEVAPRESARTGLITGTGQEVTQKEKEVSASSRK